MAQEREPRIGRQQQEWGKFGKERPRIEKGRSDPGARVGAGVEAGAGSGFVGVTNHSE